MLVLLGYLLSISFDYGRGGLFPVVFLSMGIVALLFELTTEVALPKRQADVVKAYLDGITSDVEDSFGEQMEEEDEEEEEEESREEKMADQAGITVDFYKRIGILVALIFGYGVVSFLIGVLYAIPFFVIPAIYLVGSQSMLRAIVVMAITMITIYGLFGVWMNIPIFDGVLLG
jgi:uncharacterized membrane protein YdbT with pleckstrin-like domain